MKKFDSKKLLVLGSNVSSTDIVAYAKENGAYTIVADYLPAERSPAKLVADENVLISTADVDTLDELIKTRHIDGVLAGIHEFNLLKAMELCERNGLPFYCTREQWELLERKDLFRRLCGECGVPCPLTYYIGESIPEDCWKEIRYPAVIKPVDASSSAGVHICNTEEELRGYEKDSLEQSESGRIIVEECVRGDEFTAHYTIVNGRASFSCVDNRYPVAVHEGRVTTIPAARLFPSLFLSEYFAQVNQPMLKLCEATGVKNGVMFIQGMYDKEGNSFHVFEAGLRSAGEAPYRFIERVNCVNYLHVIVDHALSVTPNFCAQLEDPTLKGKCCGVVSFVAKGGTVGNIIGLEEAVRNTPSVIEYESRYPVGTETPNTDTLRQLMIRFVMICDSREQMARDIKYLNDHITVLNDQGENMVIKMDPERVFGTK